MGQAARLFNGMAAQTLYGRVTPTLEQRQLLQEHWNALADRLKDRLSNRGYSISTWIQGSYKYGTLIKPVHKGEEYDVDVGIYFSWDPNETDLSPSPQQLRCWVQQELLEYQKEVDALVKVVDPPKERCSRAIYMQQFHIDTPTYHLNPVKDARRLACMSGSWESSDPKLLYKWFRDVAGTDNLELMRRLIRYLKGWAAVAFKDAPKARPSSIFLTVTVAEAFSEVCGTCLPGIADDDALIAVIAILFQRFGKDSRVPNPVDGKENLNRIPKDLWDTFITRLKVLNEAAQAADAAEDEVSAAFAWEGAFSFLMPLPEADGVEVVEPATNLALMQVPDIEVRVYDNRDGKLLATHTNEVPSVAKNRKLVFDLANKHVLPKYADISWTVRNDGEEAVHIGDLGHFRRGTSMHTVDEITAYLGKHYMDCVIRLNGTIFAARRVPVNIKPDQKILHDQARRSWIMLSTRKGRRR